MQVKFIIPADIRYKFYNFEDTLALCQIELSLIKIEIIDVFLWWRRVLGLPKGWELMLSDLNGTYKKKIIVVWSYKKKLKFFKKIKQNNNIWKQLKHCQQYDPS